MKIYIVDAFTDTPFTGNPAGVCILEAPLPDATLLQIAREVKHSETAFALKHGEHYRLRWFTPKTEVPLCGHATLATAHILWEQQYEDRNRVIHFDTQSSGPLTITYVNGLIAMDFPQQFVTPVEPPDILLNALKIAPVFVGCDDLRYLLEVTHEQVVRDLHPDFDLLTRLGKRVIVTAPSANPQYDCVSRVFAPCVGVNEDPVTGSAHCYLAPYWAKKLNKQRVIGYQASSRPGLIVCELCDDLRVVLHGTARTVIRGELVL